VLEELHGLTTDADDDARCSAPEKDQTQDVESTVLQIAEILRARLAASAQPGDRQA